MDLKLNNLECNDINCLVTSQFLDLNATVGDITTLSSGDITSDVLAVDVISEKTPANNIQLGNNLDVDSNNIINANIDADNNTITNIDNADIKVAAAIDADKLAGGSCTNFQFDNYVSTMDQDVSSGVAVQFGQLTTDIIVENSGPFTVNALQIDSDGAFKNNYSAAIFRTTGIIYNPSGLATLDSVLYDHSTGDAMTTTASRITLTKSGIYSVSAKFDFNLATAGQRGIEIRRYDSGDFLQDRIVNQWEPTTAYAAKLSVAGLMKADATDYFRVFVFQTNGGNQTFSNGYLYANLVSINE